MLTDQQIKETIESTVPAVLESLRKEFHDMAVYQAKQVASNQISAYITKFMQDEVLPEIGLMLMSEKQGLIAMTPKIMEELSSQLVGAAKVHLEEKLKHSWERKKIFEALLGS